MAVLESIEITAHFDADGRITPMHFTWKGSVLRVESTGRRWTDESGQHMLVMVMNGHIYELVYKGMEGRWYIKPQESERPVV